MQGTVNSPLLRSRYCTRLTPGPRRLCHFLLFPLRCIATSSLTSKHNAKTTDHKVSVPASEQASRGVFSLKSARTDSQVGETLLDDVHETSMWLMLHASYSMVHGCCILKQFDILMSLDSSLRYMLIHGKEWSFGRICCLSSARPCLLCNH